MDPFDKWSWLSYGISILAISFLTLFIVWSYKTQLSPSKINPYTDEVFLMIRMMFGFTEPERLEFVDRARNFAGGEMACFGTILEIYIA